MRVRVRRVTGATVTLTPSGRVPKGMIGQDVQVIVTTRTVRGLIVPVAALNTSVSGQNYVIVAERSGRQRLVPVRLGLASAGQQAVFPVRGHLRAGDEVVVGRQAS